MLYNYYNCRVTFFITALCFPLLNVLDWPNWKKFNSPPPPPPPPPLDNMAAILADDVFMKFHELKWQNFDSNFTEICSRMSNWRYESIGSGKDLAPNRRQSTTWANDIPVPWRIYVALGAYELTLPPKPWQQTQLDKILNPDTHPTSYWCFIRLKYEFKDPFSSVIISTSQSIKTCVQILRMTTRLHFALMAAFIAHVVARKN